MYIYFVLKGILSQMIVLLVRWNKLTEIYTLVIYLPIWICETQNKKIL